MSEKPITIEVWPMTKLMWNDELNIEVVEAGPPTRGSFIDLPGPKRLPTRPYLEPFAGPCGVVARVLRGDGQVMPLVVLVDKTETVRSISELPLALSAGSDGGVWVLTRKRLEYFDSDGTQVHALNIVTGIPPIAPGTKIGFGHQLLIVCLTYRKRAIPIAWTWVKHSKGHSPARQQLALLFWISTMLPGGAAVFLVGDSEFGSVAVLRQLDKWHWFYILRQKANTGVWLNKQSGWRVFGSYLHKPSQSNWLPVTD